MPYLKNVMAGSLDSARDDGQSGMTHDASDAFDNTQIVASLVAPVSAGQKFSRRVAARLNCTKSCKRIAVKRYRAAAEQVDRKKTYSLTEAVATLKKFPPTKFDQTVTVSFRLGVDPKQSDQMVRGTCPLPHGSGKTGARAWFSPKAKRPRTRKRPARNMSASRI